MTKHHDADALRRHAEQRLREGKSDHALPNADSDGHRLLHELQVHQVELEIQNEELRLALLKLEEAHDRYSGLYDHAPVGYLTLTPQGMITEANLAGAALLGVARNKLLTRCFISFVAAEDRDAWQHHFLDMLQGDERQSFEQTLERGNGSHFDVQLDSVRVETDGMVSSVLINLTDVTERNLAEKAQRLLVQENRRLMRQLIQVQEEERRSLSRDLHDELGQLLTSIYARVEFITRHINDADVQVVAKEIVGDIKASFDISRAMLKWLRPVSLDVLGLPDALEELVSNWQHQTGTQCTLQVDKDIDHLDEEHNIAIYRLVQESLTNAYRHGKANHVDIRLHMLSPTKARQRSVQIEIEDNGLGDHVGEAVTGMGLIGMRERVYALGGVFSVSDLPHDGVRIEATLPL